MRFIAVGLSLRFRQSPVPGLIFQPTFGDLETSAADYILDHKLGSACFGAAPKSFNLGPNEASVAACGSVDGKFSAIRPRTHGGGMDA